MTDTTAAPEHFRGAPKFDQKTGMGTIVVFFCLLAAGLGYGIHGLLDDIQSVHEPLALGVFAMLGLALLIALGFEFVNGFHDTANAVATVIYTHSLPPLVAVIWSGVWNFLGVMVSTGAVAYTIVTLLPVELILQVGSGAGYAMIFALLIAAITWNLATWAFGIPNSSSHALIGSVLGVGLANQLMAPAGQATSGVDWNQAYNVGIALFTSPLMGFFFSAVLLLVMKTVIRAPKLYEEPAGDQPPPWWIRGLLILTCTGVSFFHGGNDGQKGMGLIMLILIGAAPTAYALNRTMPQEQTPAFVASATAAQQVFAAHDNGATAMDPVQARGIVGTALREKKLNAPNVFAGLAALSGDIAKNVSSYGSLSHVPAAATSNLRNDMYLTSEAARLLPAQGAKFSGTEKTTLKAYTDGLLKGTRYIPVWVKVCVAIALGLGTMIGWKRIVVTVGERIGKTHLTYAQGASAEIVAMATIGAAELYGVPVSTTHILSSGVAGTMAANGSGLQWGTLRSIALAWVMTLPAAMALAGGLYYVLRMFVVH
ncbi:MAG TPA: inorganic phosphate transporter [Rhizomicrobium sp.]|jgi:PiT family inorganic phosphate transporter|nr:inorganic phosphate transporter [Rhizomicrobium sp.]